MVLPLRGQAGLPAGVLPQRGQAGSTLLNREAFAASTGSRCIWINELEAFAVESVGEVECGSQQIEQTFLIDEDLHTLVFKYLIHGVDLFVKAKVIHKSGTSSTFNRDADVGTFRPSFFLAKFDNSVFGFFSNGDHIFLAFQYNAFSGNRIQYDAKNGDGVHVSAVI